jgi:putative heme-binding domain-containing protein
LQGLHAQARRVAPDEKQKEEYRRNATLLLGREQAHAEEEMQILSGLLVPGVSSDLQMGAVKALGRIRDARVVGVLTREWGSHGPALRGAILDQVLARESWTVDLLKLIEAGRIGVIDIDVPRRERLLRHRSAAVKALAERVFKSNVDASRQQVVEQNRGVLEMKADSRRGAKIFEVHCATCHRVENVGQEVGPDLAAVRSWSGEALLTAILDPDRQVEPRYIAYNATLQDGEALFGIITSETGSAITMKGLDGQPRSVLRSNLKSVSSANRSLMPVGFEEGMPRQEVADLIAFLQNPVAAN